MTQTTLLPKIDLTEAGTGKKVTIRFDEIQEREPISLPYEAYGFHRQPGGATGLQSREEYLAGGNEIDGTVLSLKGLRTVTVLQTIDEIREARDLGIASLHNSRAVLTRIDAARRAVVAEKNDGPIDVLENFGTDKAKMPGVGRTETVEREDFEIIHDLKNGRPIGGSDSAPGLVQVLKKPIRLGVPMPEEFKAS